MLALNVFLEQIFGPSPIYSMRAGERAVEVTK